MNNSNFNRVLGLCLTAFLAGCGTPQAPLIAPGSTPPQVRMRNSTATAIPGLRPALESQGYKVTAPLLYVANYTFTYNDVRVYRATAKDPTPLVTISDGIDTPSGVCIDGQGTLYVTNQPASGPGWISEYPLGKTAPSKTVTDGVSAPAFCAIDAKGNLWVTNLGGPNVTEYLYGSKKPHIVITDSLHFPVGIAIDHSGNLYVANGVGASQQNVEAYSSGSKSPSRTITNGIASPVGITVDSNGTLYVTNVDQNNIAEYRPGQDYPFQTITSGLTDPSGVTVNKKGLLYVTNYGSSTVAEFPPASLTPSKRQISKGLYNPEGIAYYPALLP
jgi:sugar lactone lactonase YvrE